MTATAEWPDFVKPGARVRFTSEDLVIEATVARIDRDLEAIPRRSDGQDDYLGIYPSAYTAELLPTPLPTKPGFYLDKDGDVWRIHREGERLIYVANPVLSDGPENYTPYTRLIPETETSR